MILDTEFLVSLKASDPGAVELAAEIERGPVPARIPAPVVHELYRAVGAGSEPNDNARELEALVASKPVVGFDENLARRAGALEGQHLRSDSKPDLGTVDAMVAATGLIHNEPVVSSDEDFQAVDGLAVETY